MTSKPLIRSESNRYSENVKDSFDSEILPDRDKSIFIEKLLFQNRLYDNSVRLSQENSLKIRFSLLKRKVLSIKAEAFCMIELQKGEVQYKPFEVTLLVLLGKL